MKYVILIVAVVGLLLIMAWTLAHAGWEECPESGEMVTITFKAPLEERGTYKESLSYVVASQDVGSRYMRYSGPMSYHLDLWYATPCLGKFEIIYEYGAEILSIDVDGRELKLEPTTNNALISEYGN